MLVPQPFQPAPLTQGSGVSFQKNPSFKEMQTVAGEVPKANFSVRVRSEGNEQETDSPSFHTGELTRQEKKEADMQINVSKGENATIEEATKCPGTEEVAADSPKDGKRLPRSDQI